MLILFHSLILLGMATHLGDSLVFLVVFLQMSAAVAVIALLAFALKHDKAAFVIPHLSFQVHYLAQLYD